MICKVTCEGKGWIVFLSECDGWKVKHIPMTTGDIGIAEFLGGWNRGCVVSIDSRTKCRR